ncbi:TetR/AcrR family transcriptional regulator [Ciceribacter sp. L1K23]|uniref:TetR/AcrR family transcriptional regulator n=1 Tax=Ciceribacter sp. L1K23 TaxID=2820276 RepID=UPI001B8141A5|nr:TetR/AcrR family transcriptional regulator [Ciceribacter sp. L1K23]MBR0556095.1 TetR/AcrR family transcriptional regulator [Ciceribacter sp. L1K23]
MTLRKAYHHGDLRKALVEAGLSMIEELGSEGLSLRKIAARVGVSHAAPEHHFPTLRHLLTALAAEGFRSFRQAMLTAMQSSPGTPPEQLRAALEGYLAFARAQPHLFRLMFDKTRLDWEDPALGEAGQAARDVLSDICRPAVVRLGLDTPAGRLSVEHLVWSYAHGYAHLFIDKKIESDSERIGIAVTPPLDLAQLLLPD